MVNKTYLVGKTHFDLATLKGLFNLASNLDLSGNNDQLTFLNSVDGKKLPRSEVKAKHFNVVFAFICDLDGLIELTQLENVEITIHESKRNMDVFVVIASAPHYVWKSIDKYSIQDHLDAL